MNREEIIKLLSEAVDLWVESIGSGRLGFDYAVKEYVDKYDNDLSRALQEYVQKLGLGNETERHLGEAEEIRHEEVRREVLHKIAGEFNFPEVTAFVTAVLESQDKRLSIWKTLQGQSEQLRQALARD